MRDSVHHHANARTVATANHWKWETKISDGKPTKEKETTSHIFTAEKDVNIWLSKALTSIWVHGQTLKRLF